MSKILDFSGGMFCKKHFECKYYMTLLRFFVTISLRKINEDDLNERDDYGVPFSEQQYTHGSCYIFRLNANPLISLIPPNGLNF